MEVNSFRQKVASILTSVKTTDGTFREQVEQFVAEARELAADGLTLAEIGQLFSALIALAVSAAMKLSNAGPDKKQLVLQAVGYLFDALVEFFPLPDWVPFKAWVRARLAPVLKEIVLLLADGAIEAVYAHLKAA